jgi:hypothetical protein
LVAGVCDHAVPDAHSETTLAKIKPAAMRIVFPLMLIASRLGFRQNGFLPLLTIA